MRVVAVFCLVSLVQTEYFLVETNGETGDTDDNGERGDIGDKTHTDDTEDTDADTGDLSIGDYGDVR